MGKKNNTDDSNSQSRTVCRNRKARREYEILDEMDCGIVLCGSEVKSVRNNKISIDESWARVDDGEVWLINADIAEYPQATVFNHESKRKRKLLLHRRQIRKFAESAAQQGCTLIPLTVYFSRGIVKVKIGLARGRKLHDKRDRMRKQDDRREMRNAMMKKR